MEKEELKGQLEKIKETMDKISGISEKDGEISDDEESLVFNIHKDLNKYKNMIMDVLEKDEVSSQELFEIKSFKAKIFERARKVAAKDGRFYENEWQILESLDEFLNT